MIHGIPPLLDMQKCFAPFSLLHPVQLNSASCSMFLRLNVKDPTNYIIQLDYNISMSHIFQYVRVYDERNIVMRIDQML